MPPGVFINEDPPLHTVHRALVSRAFTPKRMNALEEKVRAFCAACLDPLVGADRFDFVVDLGAELPMRTIGMLLGIPDAEQPTVRDHAQAQPAQPSRASRCRSRRTATSTARCTPSTSSGASRTRPTTSSPSC